MKQEELIEGFRVSYREIAERRMAAAIDLVLAEDEISRYNTALDVDKRVLDLRLSAAKSKYASIQLEVDALLDSFRASLSGSRR